MRAIKPALAGRSCEIIDLQGKPEVMKRSVGYSFGGFVSFIGLLKLALEAVHYSELLEHALPSWMGFLIGPHHAVIWLIVGILINLFIWLDHRRESDSHAESEPPPTPQATVQQTANPALTQTSSPIQTANPVQTVTANPATTVNVNLQPRHRPVTPPLQQYVPPTHNVKFLRAEVRKVWSQGDLYDDQEFDNYGMPNGSTALAVVADFRNPPIPGTRVAPFTDVKANVTYRLKMPDSPKREVLHVSACAWLGKGTDTINIDPGGDTVTAILAVFEGGRWFALSLSRFMEESMGFHLQVIRVQRRTIEAGLLEIEIILVGKDGVSLTPETISILIAPGGQATVLPATTS